MNYIIKRKFHWGDKNRSQMAAFVEHITNNPPGPLTDLELDTLTVNHLIVRKTNRIPFGTDKYK